MTRRTRSFAWCLAAAVTAAASIAPDARAQNSYRIITSAAGKVAPGNVAFVDTVGRRIVEIDRAGKVAWSWPIPASVIGAGDLRSGADLEWIAGDDSFLLVVPFRGIFRVSRAGKVVWQHVAPKVSHDADLLPNGNVLYVFGWDSASDDQVREIDTAGNLVWSWKLQGRAEEAWRVPVPNEPRPSYGHTNGAVRLPNGDTLVSVRNFNRVFRVAPAGDVKRAWGPIPRVHEPTLLPNGTLIASPHAPRPGSVIAIVAPGDRRPVFTNTLGIDPIRTVELLANGNYLLTGGEEIVEIDAAGEIVWHAAVYPKAQSIDRGQKGARRAAAEAGGRGVYKAVWVGKR